MRIFLELDFRTVRHLLNYVKELYKQPHLSSGEIEGKTCIYCLDFITKANEALRKSAIRWKIEEGRIKRNENMGHLKNRRQVGRIKETLEGGS